MSTTPTASTSAASTFEVVIEKRRRWWLSLVATLPVLLLTGGEELICPCRVTVRRRSGHTTVASYTYEFMSEANRQYGLILEHLDSDSVPDFLTYLGL